MNRALWVSALASSLLLPSLARAQSSAGPDKGVAARLRKSPESANEKKKPAKRGQAASPSSPAASSPGASESPLNPIAQQIPSRRLAALEFRSGRWQFRPFGFVRLGYEAVDPDERYDFIGRNNGFVLDSARLGFDVGYSPQFSMRLAVEAASDVSAGINTPQGSLRVRLRDAYFRYDPWRYLGVQIGQFFAPFAAEEMHNRNEMLFASRALGQEGVLPGRGLEEESVAFDRQIGVMLAPAKPIFAGPIGFAPSVMVASGNGKNQLLPDDNLPAFLARLEVHVLDYVRLAGAFVRNDRTVGAPPDQYVEKDMGFAADLRLRLAGAELFGQFVELQTKFPTVGAAERTRRAISGQAGYTVSAIPGVLLTPAYRYAYYHPWADAEDPELANFVLMYHTAGLKVSHRSLPLDLYANYTVTVEKQPRQLENNRLQIMAQAGF